MFPLNNTYMPNSLYPYAHQVIASTCLRRLPLRWYCRVWPPANYSIEQLYNTSNNSNSTTNTSLKISHRPMFTNLSPINKHSGITGIMRTRRSSLLRKS